MPITLEEYIVNPLGKKSAVMSTALREATKMQYTEKFNNVLLRENGKINYYTYRDKTNNVYYIHVKVPSEVVPKFYYDVVFKFYADETIKGGGTNLKKWYVNFFSNDPAFVYTYANVFMRNNILIPELMRKMSTEAIKNKPVEKNPDDLQYYSKIIYFGILFLTQRNLTNTVLLSTAEEFNLQTFLSRIDSADKKIEDRQTEGKKISKKKKLAVDRSTLTRLNAMGVTKDPGVADRLVTTTNKVKTIKRTSASNKKVRTVKKK